MLHHFSYVPNCVLALLHWLLDRVLLQQVTWYTMWSTNRHTVQSTVQFGLPTADTVMS